MAEALAEDRTRLGGGIGLSVTQPLSRSSKEVIADTT